MSRLPIRAPPATSPTCHACRRSTPRCRWALRPATCRSRRSAAQTCLGLPQQLCMHACPAGHQARAICRGEVRSKWDFLEKLFWWCVTTYMECHTPVNPPTVATTGIQVRPHRSLQVCVPLGAQMPAPRAGRLQADDPQRRLAPAPACQPCTWHGMA